MTFSAIPKLLHILLVRFLLVSFITTSVKSQESVPRQSTHQEPAERFEERTPPVEKIHVLTGLENLLANHAHKLRGKRLGIITNHTGIGRDGRPIWELIAAIPATDVTALFSPEHGIFGEVSDGEKIHYDDTVATARIHSLYGENRKPSREMLEEIDLLLYDIQDIGARFYTYIT